MKIKHDDQRAEKIRYMELAVAAWSNWAHRRSVNLGFPQAGDLWGINKPDQAKLTELDLDDDQLMLIDRQITKLPYRNGRKIIFVEFFTYATQETKAQRFGLSRWAYKRRLESLLYELYQSCMPDIEQWRLSILMR